jgi:uncharacterized repeat protein (TIGR01451 family)
MRSIMVMRPRRAVAGLLVAGLLVGGTSLVSAGTSRDTSRPSGDRPASSQAAKLRAQRSYADLPLSFEENAGQAPQRFDFIARANPATALISSRGATMALRGKHSTKVIALDLMGANKRAAGARDMLPGKVNYLVGNDPSRWHTNVSTFERVRYEEVYPGIGVDWYGNQRRLEYDFRIAAGADPRQIDVRVDGADGLAIARNGDLLIRTGRRTVRQGAPVAYQIRGEDREMVDARYILDHGRFTFALGAYDRTRTLVIDPVVLAYSTYLGGGGGDTAQAIAVDASGSAYVAGDTSSTDFNTVGPIEGDEAFTFEDAFVSKLNATGSALVYSTYLGGNSSDFANGIAVDADGAAYVTGSTQSTDFNTVAPIEGDEASGDAFVFKLDASGSSLVYSTYLGGNLSDAASGIAVDANGAAYVTGATSSTDFNTVGPIEGDEASSDAFVSKLNATGSALVYSTYLGGNDHDFAKAIALDAGGAAYVTGETSSTDFNTVGPIEGDEASIDAFVAKLNATGSSLVYSTYLGGSSSDFAKAIAVDADGAAYVTGDTNSTDFNTVGAIEGDEAGGDAFVSKLNATGSFLVYSTYLGGNSFDYANAIAVDADGAAYVTGKTDSTDFNTVAPIEGDEASTDAFISKLNAIGSALMYSTYLGGNSSDVANGIAVDVDGAAYVVGETDSSDFNTVGPIEGDEAFTDAFVSKIPSKIFAVTDVALSMTDSPDPVTVGQNLVYALAAFNAGPDEAKDVVVTDTLPAGVSFVSASTGCTHTSGVVTCSIGSIPLSQVKTVQITVQPSAAGTLMHQASVASDYDTEPSNDTATEQTTVNAAPPPGPTNADLALSKSDSSDPAAVGQDLVYTLAVQNLGPDDASTVSIQDTLPSTVTFVSSSAGCANTSGTVTCGLGTVAKGTTRTVQITVQPTAAGTIMNTATVSSDTSDPQSSNNTGAEDTTVSPASPAPPVSGDTSSPETTIVGQPAEKTKDSTPTFRFVSDEAGSVFECSVDDAPFAACDSPFTAQKLGAGPHAFRVRAVDRAGNTDPTPDKFAFKVKKKRKKH